MASEHDIPVLIFSILQIVGATGFSVILLTVLLSTTVKRSFTWISFTLGWIFACVSYDLLFFTGEQAFGTTPNHTHCLIQASLVESVPVLQATTNLALIVDTWFLVRTVLLPPFRGSKRRLITSVSLVCFPHIFFLCVFIGYLLFGVSNPSTVKKVSSGAYCTLGFNRLPSGISTGLFGFFLAIAMIFKFLLGRLLYQHWVSLAMAQQKYIKMVVRILVIASINGIMVILTALRMGALINGTAVDICLAIFPVLVVLMFATEKASHRRISTWMILAHQPPGPGAHLDVLEDQTRPGCPRIDRI